MDTADGTGPGWVRYLWGYMLRHRADVFASVGAALLGGAAQTAVPLVERQIVDGVIIGHRSTLWPWLLLLVVLGTAIFGFAYVRRYRGGRVALAVQYDLRNAMHDHLVAMDATALSAMPTGQLVGRASSDTTLVQGLLNFFPIMSSNILLVLLSLVVMLFLSPLLALISLVVVPAVLGISYHMRWRVFPATWEAQQREGDVVQIVDEDLAGVRVVKAFARERRELERIVEASVTLYGSQMRAVRIQARFQPLLEAVPALGQVAVLTLGGWLALHGRISLGTFLAFSTYVTQLVAPAQRLAGVLTIGQQARAGIERIFQLLDQAPAIADAADAADLPRGPGRIDFDDVTFAYRDGPPVLDGLDLHIAPGERVALVGPSGSGKSTVAMLVSRFYDPGRGAVRVDGHDVRAVTRRSLRSQVGVVFEENFLFSDSVRENIAYGRPDATDAEIEAAARAAGAHDFITGLPRGYDTVVGERGLTLSGGQRQRVALARALLTDPRILVLDDATSAVDARTEEAIHDALREVTAGRTTLLVAHRRSTLHLADRIVVLDGGRVVDQGTHEALVERSPLYRSLLTGLDEEPVVESSPTGIVLGSGVTASAWTGDRRAGRDSPVSRSGAVSPGVASIGPGLGGGGGGNWKANLAPTPEILARVAELPPVEDVPEVDLEAESRPDPHFSLPRLLVEFRRPLLFGLFLVVLDALATLAGPVLVKTGVDDGVRVGSQGVLFGASAVYLAVIVADLFDQIGETFVTGRATQRIMLSLRIRVWAQLQRLSLDYYESELAGRIMTRMTTDVDQFESLIQNGLLSALVSAVTFVGVGVALVAINPELGLCTLSVVVPLAFATVAFRRRSARLYDLARERIAIVNADFQESLSGVREAQAFVHEEATIGRFHRLGRDYLETRVAAQRLVATYFPFVQFLATVANAVVLGVGARLIAGGHLTTGELIAFILYIDLFFAPIQQLSQVFDAWQQTKVSVSRIADLMVIESRTPPAAEPVTPGALAGELQLEEVRFAYPGAPVRPGRVPTALHRAPTALDGLSLHIAAGETVALVGETGAGKSTVMKLLARFYDPDAGRVLIDGLDLRDLDIAAYRRRLGYVPQEAFLFTGTVRDNIAYGRPGATDADVEAAARAVGAHPFIAALPGGYLNELDERGRSLSAGQRQLIALARAELVDPAVLLLDEATSNLDLATEGRVAEAMRRVARGRTTIIIAHRLATAATADRIVLLERGRVAEAGTHAELLAAGRRYAELWAASEAAADPRPDAAA
ncbi:MAG TPA: ABC transporter ATP-binding protein [Acidimicrobiia bacterium]|nr:ABC transporter ATP-binding protein [Acidimicrobiia bacterium]